jgi:hypothetical protein
MEDGKAGSEPKGLRAAPRDKKGSNPRQGRRCCAATGLICHKYRSDDLGCQRALPIKRLVPREGEIRISVHPQPAVRLKPLSVLQQRLIGPARWVGARRPHRQGRKTVMWHRLCLINNVSKAGPRQLGMFGFGAPWLLQNLEKGQRGEGHRTILAVCTLPQK